MQKLLPVLAAIGMSLMAIQLPAKAETWWLVVAGKMLFKDSSLSYLIPMENETQCEVAGSKLLASTRDGSLRKADVDKLGYACVTGK